MSIWGSGLVGIHLTSVTANGPACGTLCQSAPAAVGAGGRRQGAQAERGSAGRGTPCAQGFVSNRDSERNEDRADPLEIILYAVFVATSARASVAQLADILQVSFPPCRSLAVLSLRVRSLGLPCGCFLPGQTNHWKMKANPSPCHQSGPASGLFLLPQRM